MKRIKELLKRLEKKLSNSESDHNCSGWSLGTGERRDRRGWSLSDQELEVVALVGKPRPLVGASGGTL